MDSFQQIIKKWPDRSALASDLGVMDETIKGWIKRESIPANYWKRLIAAGAERGIYVSPDKLIDLAARD